MVATGEPGVQILAPRVVKADLRALPAMAGTHPERALIRERLVT